jgi:hypothetical protein
MVTAAHSTANSAFLIALPLGLPLT